MAEEYVVIYSHEGIPLAEVEPASLTRSWVLSGIGRGRMELPLTEPKLDAGLIRYGNLVAVFSDSVPLWGGVILPPCTITPTMVKFSLYSGEALLKNRAIELATGYRGTAGAVFRKIIQMVQREYQSNLVTGDISESGRKLRVVEPCRDAFDLVQMLIEKRGGEFRVEPLVKRGKLRFHAHWLRRVGQNRTDQLRLMEGHNISSKFTIEQTGDLIDEVIVLGKGDDPESRPQVRASLPIHTGLFGKWCHVVEAFDVEEQDELQAFAAEALNEIGLPAFRLMVELLDVAGAWQEFGLGDTVGIDLVSFQYSPSYVAPFRGKARILACSFDVTEGKMPIVVESYFDETLEEGIGK